MAALDGAGQSAAARPVADFKVRAINASPAFYRLIRIRAAVFIGHLSCFLHDIP